MLKLYDHRLSGNCYKVRLLLSFLQLEYESVLVDLLKGEHRSPEFLQINAFGQVPVLTDGEQVIQDAQGILVYLARQFGDETWLPLAPEPMSRVMRWLSTAAGEIRQGPESARLYHLFKIQTINIEVATQKSENILRIMDDHLTHQDWLGLDHPTIGDVACFPYVALAGDGQISLDSYPQVRGWIERVKQLPNFTGMAGIE
ncbi:MAG: glutathione S-transferase [Oscillatoriales cyanobacterium RM1_1_9]|nr:glutathione S-transferase [Oscillatoriales cyanobacterium SM2_3_0]NJO46817.1 glutathione S-transferase [Oscillatoriales cyanobacterium RM2_1_1]NJO71426.1 glutathione S-transferase [Oscillatoriales cyanobacterium RM1_1_9]